MKKNFAASALVVLLLVAVHASAQDAGSKASKAGLLMDDHLGQVVADFKLPDADGAEHTLASLKGKQGTVLIFVAVQCPVSNAYNERIEQLARDYRARGVNVVGINANSTETREEVKHHASEHNLTFPILKDDGNRVADLLDARRTPEAFLLDAKGKLVYRGAIDNDRANHLTSEARRNHLRDAIEATLKGQPITVSKVNAFGCTIKRAS